VGVGELENTKKSNNNKSSDGIIDDANSVRIQAYSDDSEIGKIANNLFVAQFQSEKLRSRLENKFVGYVHKADVYYSRIDAKEMSSSFEFSYKGKRYRISIDIDKSDIPDYDKCDDCAV
jgi:hypothetical protein